METKQEVLQACTVNGNVVKLPPRKLDRTLYLAVADAIQDIGGKWKGGKTAGFVFDHDPSELLSEIAKGAKRNLKKESQFFETPPELADRLVDMADINHDDLLVLEPSAGRGAIIGALQRKAPRVTIHCYELLELNRSYLQEFKGLNILGSDFLNARPILYDRIVANPPFSKNQDIQHITKMYYWLNRGGRLVTLASQHWQGSSNKREMAFAKWARAVDAKIIPLDAAAFKENGISVSSCIIQIDKHS